VSDEAGDEALDELAEEFAGLIRAGKNPSIEDFAAKHPDLASDIRDIFPAIEAMELAKRGEEKSDAAAAKMPERVAEFRVVRELGRGGMGVVYEAVQDPLERRVALKILPPRISGDPVGAERFLQEARATAGIKHPNLVTVYQAGKDGDLLYLAMELLEGESLEQRMRRTPRPELRELLRVFREIAAGLSVIHSHGLIHRDIKPSNIFLEGENGRVRILDFGLARSSSSKIQLTRKGDILGTPAYMSPEQARGEQVDARSDLFSLGCVMYAVCTGKRPFRGESLLDQLTSLAVDKPLPPQQLNMEIPEPLSQLILKMLMKIPDNRPGSAAELLCELNSIEKIVAEPVSEAAALPIKSSGDIAQRSTTSARRRILLPAIAGTVCAATALFVFITRQPEAAVEPAPIKKAAPVFPISDADVTALVSAHSKPANGTYVIELPLTLGEGIWIPKESGIKDRPLHHVPRHVFEIFSVGGRSSPHAIGMHPIEHSPADIIVRLDKKFKSFCAIISLNDPVYEAHSAMTFEVIGDGVSLWQSKPVTSRSETQLCEVSVAGVTTLTLKVSCAGDDRGTHAVWFEPYVTR